MGAPWDDSERAAVRVHDPVRGPRWDGWDELLRGRTDKQVAAMAGKLGVRYEGRSRAWDARETATLLALYPPHGPDWDGWAEALPGRTRDAICVKARRMGVHRRGCGGRWAGWEDVEVCEHFPERGPHWDGWAEVLPTRTRRSIENRARTLGVRHDPVGRPRCDGRTGGWSAAEDTLLLRALADAARSTGHTAAEATLRWRELVERGEVDGDGR